MHSFTVYESKSSHEFRLVSGEHKSHENAAKSSVRVYQGTTAVDAALAAYTAETRNDIRTQISRFIPANRLCSLTPDGDYAYSRDSAPRPTSDAGTDSAAVAVNSGGALYAYIVSVWKTRADRQNWADPIKQFHVTATLPDDAGRACLRESGYSYAEVSLENGDFCGEVTL